MFASAQRAYAMALRIASQPANSIGVADSIYAGNLYPFPANLAQFEARLNRIKTTYAARGTLVGLLYAHVGSMLVMAGNAQKGATYMFMACNVLETYGGNNEDFRGKNGVVRGDSVNRDIENRLWAFARGLRGWALWHTYDVNMRDYDEKSDSSEADTQEGRRLATEKQQALVECLHDAQVNGVTDGVANLAAAGNMCFSCFVVAV
jgi:hypothetical protein